MPELHRRAGPRCGITVRRRRRGRWVESAASLALAIALLVTASYTLDGAGNRWAETVDGETTAFDLDLRSATPTVLSDGVRDYLPGDPGAGDREGGAWTTTLTDLTGSPLLSVAETGATASLTRYDPYGTSRTGGTSPAGIGYTGEWTDPGGLTNLRARAYDPALARFLSRDTFGGLATAPQSGNRSAYAQGNPLRFTDPSGHFVQTLVDNPGEALALAVDVSPLGIAHWGVSAALGYDPLTGRTLEPWERTAAAVAVAAIPAARIVARALRTGPARLCRRARDPGVRRVRRGRTSRRRSVRRAARTPARSPSCGRRQRRCKRQR